ncbi:hypothetical protein ACEPAI_8772 [Sanghuangporus weigelae]
MHSRVRYERVQHQAASYLSIYSTISHSDAKLFQLIRVGNLDFAHRIVLAPLTRFRADNGHVPTDIMVEYYAQSARVPGTLLITEATFITARAGGYNNVPGFWSDEQVAGWKKVTDAVHAQGSYVYLQLWQLGRTAKPEILALPDCPRNPGGPYSLVSSDVPLPDKKDASKPRPLTHEEILEYIELFGKAAHNAVHRAGFDGVEIAKKVVSIVGEERAGIRPSPFNTLQVERMRHIQRNYAYLVSRIREDYPRFAFLHVVEPRIAGVSEREVLVGESNDFLRAIWKGPDSEKNGSVYLSAGGYTAESALKDAEELGDLIVFGRYYISNPDLPARVKKNTSFTPYDRSKFYARESLEGYVDYSFADPEAEAFYNAEKEKRERNYTPA